MYKIPEKLRKQILELLTTPKKIPEVSEKIHKSPHSVARYLRMMLKNGDVEKITNFMDMRSFFYVKASYS